MAPLADRVQQLTGIDLQDLAGATVAGELPVSAVLVNRLIARRLARMQTGPVADARVAPHAGQAVTVTLSMRGQKLVPVLNIAARIEQQPQFPRPAVLGLRWSLPGLGPLAMFAGPALSFFRLLPPGIRVDGDRLTVDLAELLRQQGLAEIVEFITRLEIETREGMFLVRYAARVPATASESAASR